MSPTDRPDAPGAEAPDHAVTHTPARSTGTEPFLVRAAVIAVAAVSGVLAAVGGPSPTGNPTVDAVLVFLGVAAVVRLGSAALRWDTALATLLAGVLSWTPIGLALGLVTAAAGFVPPVPADRRPVVNALLVGVAMNLAARSELQLFLGASTIAALALAAYVAGVGLRRSNRRLRRTTAAIVGGTAAIALVGTVAFGVVGSLAADDLRTGNELAEQGLTHLGDGDIDAAQTAFAAAADAFDSAGGRVGSVAAAPAGFVPGVAQHRRAANELSTEAADASRLLVEELARVDLDTLSVTDGRIDVESVRELQSPLNAIQLRIEQLAVTLADLDSPWLIPPVAARLDRISDEVGDQLQRSTDALSVAMEAPALLGADGPRHYFIAFTTPAEARGIGGFMGNWAEITLTNGLVEMTAFGRADDLNLGGDPSRRRVRAEDAELTEWLARYGAYGIATGPGGTTGPEVWKNLTMSPDMTATGRAIADLYPQSGGGELDGVFVMDVYTLSRFLHWTGPIPLPDGQVVDGQDSVSVDNAADFLLNDQYDVIRTAERVDVLEEFSGAVIDELLSGTLPAPTELLDTLGPMVDQGRFAGWAARPAEQSVLEQIGLAGTFEPAGTDDGLAIVFNNAVGNKIDYYLDAEATYSVDADGATNTAAATLHLRLTNSAPADGEPNYVIGNPIGLPTATNRTMVSIYSQLPVTGATVDGTPIDTEPGFEAGYFVTSVFVTAPSGESRALTFAMEGPLDVAEGYELVVRTPPAVAPVPLALELTWSSPDGVEHLVEQDVRDPGAVRVRVPVAAI